MPATSGSPTQIATSQPTKAALSNTPADQFQSGDLGYVQEELVAGRCPLFSLVQSGGPTVDGTLVLVGYLGELDPALDTSAMVLQRKSVAGSLIGGIAETQELLDFCGQHGITSDIETIRIQDINTAYARMLKSDVKYRFVIDMGSIKAEAG